MPGLLFSMTVDPDGAMHDWVDLPPGWTMTKVPTQELVHLLGPAAYQELLIDLCRQEHPAALVTHPPYDHLTAEVAATLRRLGTRLVGYAFDDEIFAGRYTAATWAELGRIYDRYVTTRDVPWATAPLPAVARLPEKWDVVLVGRRTSGRALLVERLRDAGLRVATGGLGWPEGHLSRPEMLARYAQAAVVLTTADWEGHPVPMVKHRLLDTAMLGCFQVAQEAPDLRRYFPATEVPAYDSPEELLAQVRRALADPAARLAAADAARRRALAEHTWQVRWPSLFAGLGVAAPPPPGAAPEATREASPGGRSRLFDQALLALASRAEADGRPGAAAALAGELLLRDPGQPTAAAIRGRCLRDLGDPAGALPLLEQAAAAAAAPGAAALFVQLSPQGVGCGLGRFGLWPPAAEPTVFLLAALLQLGRHDEALARIAGLSPGPLAEAVATVLDPGDAPELAPVREALARWRPVGR